MDASQYERIKTKIEEAKRGLAKAEGANERILSDLADKFSCKSIEEAEKMIAEIKEDIEALDKRKANLYAKLEAVADWSTL